jgi:TDG/mug DNA glycosylase family protein
MILPDVISAKLRVVFCGTAAGAASARASAYYAGPGNAFWSTLHEIGLTSVLLAPTEYPRLLGYGIGLTDLCKLRSGSDRSIGSGGFDVARLVSTMTRYRPTMLAFNGKKAAQIALGRRRVLRSAARAIGRDARIRAALHVKQGAEILGCTSLAPTHGSSGLIAAIPTLSRAAMGSRTTVSLGFAFRPPPWKYRRPSSRPSTTGLA